VFHRAVYIFNKSSTFQLSPQRRANKKKQSAKVITAAQDAAQDTAYIDEVEAFLAEGEDQPAKVGESRKRGPDEVSFLYSICVPLCLPILLLSLPVLLLLISPLLLLMLVASTLLVVSLLCLLLVLSVFLLLGFLLVFLLLLLVLPVLLVGRRWVGLARVGSARVGPSSLG